jgi:hypothetical protein
VIQGKTLLGIISVSDILFKSDFVEKPKRLFIEDEIEAAREDARAICAAKGETSPDCALGLGCGGGTPGRSLPSTGSKNRGVTHFRLTAKPIPMP